MGPREATIKARRRRDGEETASKDGPSRVDPAGVGRILAEDHRLNSMLGVWFYERNPFERSFT
jgi:hypothetical protein